MTTRRLRAGRPGTFVPILAVCLVGIFAFVALAIDLGLLTVARNECQNAADGGALAGARLLNNRPDATDNNRAAAEQTAADVVKQNVVWNANFTDAQVTTRSAMVYTYDTSSQTFALSGTKGAGQSWSAMKVRVDTTQNTFFAKVFGVSSMQTGAVAVAVHRPRDIAFVLDFSGSMRFDSTASWPYHSYSATSIEGLMNPDPVYPQFGHYGWYPYYQTNNPSNASSVAGSSNPSARPNPFCMRAGYSIAPYSYSPNNHTMTSVGGPPMIEDFRTAPGNPTTVDPTTLQNAFKMWSPTQLTAPDTSTLTPATYDFSGYDASTAACPAPANFATQSDTPVAYVGDKWPRKDGGRGPNGSNPWSTLSGNTFTDAAAYTLSDFLGNPALTSNTGRSLAGWTLPTAPGYTAPSTSKPDGGTSWANYRDSIWEAYGYDLDVSDLRSQGVPKTVRLLPPASRFKGYSMGPMYWGKTPFIWPPDPRYDSSADPTKVSTTNPAQDVNGKWICDWRRRFFLRGDGTAFDPQTDDINGILFRTSGAGYTLNQPSSSASAGSAGWYRLNYKAILAWIKSGPQTLPGNLRAGRILYYASIPDDVDAAPGSTASIDLDKRFWREYIHYIFGVQQFSSSYPVNDMSSPQYNPQYMMAGTERRFTFGGSLSKTTTATFTPTGFSTPNPKPYMSYTDNINRPRMNLWFGPYTMMLFSTGFRAEWRVFTAGTIREAQSWQLKAAIASCLDDIQYNHPNDYAGIAFFANRTDANNKLVFNTPRAPMGQDWYRLKNCLYYRKDMLETLAAMPASQRDTAPNEERPYDASFNETLWNQPHADGGTDPNSGLSVAFNLLSSSTSLSTTDYPTLGRRGAAKIVIYETDGVPNSTNSFGITGTGSNTCYVYGNSPESWTKDSSLSSYAQSAMAVVNRIVAPVTTSSSAQSGFSLPNTPARIYSIAFGDMFEGYDGTNYTALASSPQDALHFLTRVAQVGNTLSPADPTMAVGNGPGQVIIPYNQVITGPYQRPNPAAPVSASNPAGRLEKLADCLQRIMQSGVQVTLIQ